jgi:hypothetical protein
VSTRIRWSHGSMASSNLSSPPMQACPLKCALTSLHIAEDLVVEVVDRARIVRFWHNPHAQDGLRRELIHTLDNRAISSRSTNRLPWLTNSWNLPRPTGR